MTETKYEMVTLKFLVPDILLDGAFYAFESKEIMLEYAELYDLQNRAGGGQLADEFRRCAKASDEAAKRKDELSPASPRVIKDGKIY